MLFQRDVAQIKYFYEQFVLCLNSFIVLVLGRVPQLKFTDYISQEYFSKMNKKYTLLVNISNDFTYLWFVQ